MINIMITDVIPFRIVGVYDNGGVWTQASRTNFATAVAVLDEVPTSTGLVKGNVYADSETFYSPYAGAVANVTFAPVEIKRTSAIITINEGTQRIEGLGIGVSVDFNTKYKAKIISQYQE